MVKLVGYVVITVVCCIGAKTIAESTMEILGHSWRKRKV